jgi:hypothetical protein
MLIKEFCSLFAIIAMKLKMPFFSALKNSFKLKHNFLNLNNTLNRLASFHLDKQKPQYSFSASETHHSNI